jgi:hypothetical protein
MTTEKSYVGHGSGQQQWQRDPNKIQAEIDAYGGLGAEPARETILIGIEKRTGDSVQRLCLASQKIEGIMRRAGIDIPCPEPEKAGLDRVQPDDDLTRIDNTLALLAAWVVNIERLADALAVLA